MTHRAETIMSTLVTTLTGLTTTDDRIKRGRAYPVAADGAPALTLEQGADQIVDEVDNIAVVDRLLSVRIIAHVKTGDQFDTALNAIREEVHIAMMANRQQGLPGVVIDTLPAGDDAPELEALEKNVGTQVMNFAIMYRHSLTDPGA